ncbi:hypothetical protein [Marinobacterium arenosum]|uniref:hypothetical protein n=1 Tax=Marinobacterium arenosum TaxID=2862496 RepID=UPI001C945245|nr:hypothetical protein [Marinobacterium arenosum]MBY4677659.1 hypothetical protein [Marinobacterium arenosum]
MQKLLCPETLATAWRWLLQQRRHFPANADSWHLRFHKTRLLAELIAEIAANRYLFSLLQRVRKADGS